MQSLLTDIEARMPEFSKSQRVLAKYMIEHYERAAFMTAAKLGAAVGVSESTVVRFAIEMGFEGYPEMQTALRNYSKNRLTTLQRLDIASDRLGNGNLLKNVFSQDSDRLRATLETLSEEHFNAAVEKIVSAEHIYIFGAMSSNILARFLYNYLSLIFDSVIFVQPINTSGILQQLIRIGEKDVMISMSFPRYSKNTLHATAYAKKSGANIIAVTDSATSPLADYADELLLAKSDMVSFADSLVAPLCLMNALLVAVGMRCRPQLEQNLMKLEALWDENEAYKKDDEG